VPKLSSVFGTFANLEPYSTIRGSVISIPDVQFQDVLRKRLAAVVSCRVAGEYVRISVLFTLPFAVFIVSGRVNG